MKIAKAKYINGSISDTIFAKKITKNEHFKKYRGFLFCTEQGCTAKLSFVERKKNDSKYFRTWCNSNIISLTILWFHNISFIIK